MPILETCSTPFTYLIWHVTETTDELYSKVMAFQDVSYEASHITHDRRRREFLAARLAIRELLGNKYTCLLRTEHGAPKLLGDNSPYISISHCNYHVLVAISYEHPLGVDIQLIQDKLQRVRNKFLSTKEDVVVPANDLRTLAVYWAAKESVYKVLKTPCRLREIQVVEFDHSAPVGVCKICVFGQFYSVHYDLNQFTGYVIAFGSRM